MRNPNRILRRSNTGFTLIELSIVLVIIGLVAGGVLVGSDLIEAARLRQQLGQIEKYNTSVYAFKSKYNNLPGDITNPWVDAFGFTPRPTSTGIPATSQGSNGDGIIAYNVNDGLGPYRGEQSLFWRDLFDAGMVEGPFNLMRPDFCCDSFNETNRDRTFPRAKIGNNNSVYVWSTNYDTSSCPSRGGIPHFGISAVTDSAYERIISQPGITVSQAYQMDVKSDDGLPQTGRIRAIYVTAPGGCARAYWAGTTVGNKQAITSATPGSGTTCFDNGNV